MKTENKNQSTVSPAVASALAKAKSYFKDSFEHYEIWEKSATEVTIRAWDNSEDANHEFFTAPILTN